jgi:predicted PurR-regulated permease PerM
MEQYAIAHMFPTLTPGRLVLIAMLGGLLYGCMRVLGPFWSELFMAGVLAIVFYPVHGWLTKKTGRSGLAALLTSLGVGFLFLLPLGLFGLVLVREAKGAYDHFNQSFGPSGGFEFWGVALDKVSGWIGVPREQLDDMLWGKLQGLAGGAAAKGLESLQGVGSWFASSFISLITLYFLLDSGKQILEGLRAWSPVSREAMDSLFAEIEKLVFANVYGVLSVSLAQGTLLAIGFWFMGLPSAVLWGTVTAVLSVIPMFGAGLVWVPAAVYLFAIGSVGKGLGMLAWGALVVSMADNVIRPLVLGERAQMHTGVMFFALLGGVQAFGLIGLFAGPIFFSLAIAVARLLRQESERITVIETSS